MKRWGMLALALLLTVLACTALADTGDLELWFERWHCELPPEVLDALKAQEPEEMPDCGPARITMTQMLLDGCSVHMAVRVEGIDENVLLMPGNLEIDMPISEGSDQTWLDAAKAENKRLLAVYGYPREFDGELASVYMLDHQANEDGSVTLYSGAALNEPVDALTLHLLVELYEVDLETGKYNRVESSTYPLDIEVITPPERSAYDCEGELRSVTLIKTALGTTLRPEWAEGVSGGNYMVTLCDAEGNQLPSGRSFVWTTYALEELPDELWLKLTDMVKEKETLVKGVKRP